MNIVEVTDKVMPIAIDLVKQFDFYFINVDVTNVRFVEHYYGKPTKILAQCHAVGSLFSYFTHCYYIIEFACPSFYDLTDNQKEIILLHELFHIPPGGTDPEDKMFMKIRPHTIQDFSPIIDKYGTDWQWKDFEEKMLGK